MTAVTSFTEASSTTLAGLFTRETPVNNLVGPVGIAQLSGRTAQLGWIPLLTFMSMISLNLDLLNGISFSKGCYTGQEIVARTQNLGRIKRRTFR